MIQINTGRFFKTEDVYRTTQRTVLYSNYRGYNPIDTVAGSYAPANSTTDVASAVYIVDQILEASMPDGTPSILVAVHSETLAQDFAVLVSFCLRITCALDPALVSRLTQSIRPPIGVTTHPSQLVDQIFDREVRPHQVDETLLPRFVADLVQLERVRFKAVMRAIRRYVIGLHRIGDDPALAYALLVASIESLAQDFDQFKATWEDFDPDKKRRIDKALTTADVTTRKAVRSVVLENEHIALRRRYQEFALGHLPSSFYREEAADRGAAARAGDLPLALKHAYAFRSRLVHQLEELPGQLVLPLPRTDIVQIDGKPALTFSGLARIARRVIMQFVELSPKLAAEDFNYRSDLPNVMRAPLAPRYWMWRAENYNARTARRYLSGFLRELESLMLGRKTGITDMSNVLKKIERQVPTLAPCNRRPMVALYLLWHQNVAEELRRPDAEVFFQRHLSDLEDVSIESLICYTILSHRTGWDPDEQEQIRIDYQKQRYHKGGIRLGPVFEVALTLDTAEAFRLSGKMPEALSLIADAVENMPGEVALLDLEQTWLAGKIAPIRWRDILLRQDVVRSSDVYQQEIVA